MKKVEINELRIIDAGEFPWSNTAQSGTQGISIVSMGTTSLFTLIFRAISILSIIIFSSRS